MVTMETISKQLADKQFITYHYGNHFLLFKRCLATVTMVTVTKQLTDKQFIKLSPWKPFPEYNDLLPSNHYYGNCFKTT